MNDLLPHNNNRKLKNNILTTSPLLYVDTSDMDWEEDIEDEDSIREGASFLGMKRETYAKCFFVSHAYWTKDMEKSLNPKYLTLTYKKNKSYLLLELEAYYMIYKGI